jgi:hypothetical protein
MQTKKLLLTLVLGLGISGAGALLASHESSARTVAVPETGGIRPDQCGFGKVYRVIRSGNGARNALTGGSCVAQDCTKRINRSTGLIECVTAANTGGGGSNNGGGGAVVVIPPPAPPANPPTNGGGGNPPPNYPDLPEHPDCGSNTNPRNCHIP